MDPILPGASLERECATSGHSFGCAARRARASQRDDRPRQEARRARAAAVGPRGEKAGALGGGADDRRDGRGEKQFRATGGVRESAGRDQHDTHEQRGVCGDIQRGAIGEPASAAHDQP